MTTCATRCCPTFRTRGSTDKTKIGYEIPLTRHFYKYVPPRPLEEIDAEIKALNLVATRSCGRTDLRMSTGGGALSKGRSA